MISDGQQVGQLYANDFDCTANIQTEPTACGLVFSIGIGSEFFDENNLSKIWFESAIKALLRFCLSSSPLELSSAINTVIKRVLNKQSIINVGGLNIELG